MTIWKRQPVQLQSFIFPVLSEATASVSTGASVLNAGPGTTGTGGGGGKPSAQERAESATQEPHPGQPVWQWTPWQPVSHSRVWGFETCRGSEKHYTRKQLWLCVSACGGQVWGKAWLKHWTLNPYVLFTMYIRDKANGTGNCTYLLFMVIPSCL